MQRRTPGPPSAKPREWPHVMPRTDPVPRSGGGTLRGARFGSITERCGRLRGKDCQVFPRGQAAGARGNVEFGDTQLRRQLSARKLRSS